MCQETAALEPRRLGQLRQSAGWWHWGQWMAPYAFSSTGSIVDGPSLPLGDSSWPTT
jgi:hypothetical protein